MESVLPPLRQSQANYSNLEHDPELETLQNKGEYFSVVRSRSPRSPLLLLVFCAFIASFGVWAFKFARHSHEAVNVERNAVVSPLEDASLSTGPNAVVSPLEDASLSTAKGSKIEAKGSAKGPKIEAKFPKPARTTTTPAATTTTGPNVCFNAANCSLIYPTSVVGEFKNAITGYCNCPAGFYSVGCTSGGGVTCAACPLGTQAGTLVCQRSGECCCGSGTSGGRRLMLEAEDISIAKKSKAAKPKSKKATKPSPKVKKAAKGERDKTTTTTPAATTTFANQCSNSATCGAIYDNSSTVLGPITFNPTTGYCNCPFGFYSSGCTQPGSVTCLACPAGPLPNTFQCQLSGECCCNVASSIPECGPSFFVPPNQGICCRGLTATDTGIGALTFSTSVTPFCTQDADQRPVLPSPCGTDGWFANITQVSGGTNKIFWKYYYGNYWTLNAPTALTACALNSSSSQITMLAFDPNKCGNETANTANTGCIMLPSKCPGSQFQTAVGMQSGTSLNDLQSAYFIATVYQARTDVVQTCGYASQYSLGSAEPKLTIFGEGDSYGTGQALYQRQYYLKQADLCNASACIALNRNNASFCAGAAKTLFYIKNFPSGINSGVDYAPGCAFELVSVPQGGGTDERYGNALVGVGRGACNRIQFSPTSRRDCGAISGSPDVNNSLATKINFIAIDTNSGQNLKMEVFRAGTQWLNMADLNSDVTFSINNAPAPPIFPPPGR